MAACVRKEQRGDGGRRGCSVTDGAVRRRRRRSAATRPKHQRRRTSRALAQSHSKGAPVPPAAAKPLAACGARARTFTTEFLKDRQRRRDPSRSLSAAVTAHANRRQNAPSSLASNSTSQRRRSLSSSELYAYPRRGCGAAAARPPHICGTSCLTSARAALPGTGPGPRRSLPGSQRSPSRQNASGRRDRCACRAGVDRPALTASNAG